MPRKRPFPNAQVSLGLLLLRLAGGGTMLMAHGWGKASGFLTRMSSFPDPFGLSSPVSLGLAVFAEVLCAMALILGFYSRWASVPLVITMLTAAFVVHADDPWSQKELPLLYAFLFTVQMITGPGRYSIDRIRLGKNAIS